MYITFDKSVLLDINYNNRSFLLCIIISVYENVSTYRFTGPIIYILIMQCVDKHSQDYK